MIEIRQLCQLDDFYLMTIEQPLSDDYIRAIAVREESIG